MTNIRYDLDESKIFRKIYINGKLNFEVTTKYLPEVGKELLTSNIQIVALTLDQTDEYTNMKTHLKWMSDKSEDTKSNPGWLERWSQLDHRWTGACLQWNPLERDCYGCSGVGGALVVFVGWV